MVMSRIAGAVVLVLLVATTIGCDRVTKHIAKTSLDGTAGRSFFADTVRLVYAENTGGFLSLGADLAPVVRTAIFTIGTGLVLAATLMAAVRLDWTALQLVALSLMFAGGASNWIDRVARGTVVDFLNVGVGPLRTGVFNVADVALMLGGVILAFTYRQKIGTVRIER
jgi:signal peptidase II